MPVKEFDLLVNDEGDNAHVRIRTVRGDVVDFAVIYEAWIDGAFRQVVRHDASHKVAHRDLLNWDGTKLRTDQLFHGMSYWEALNAAIDDIKEHWAMYRSHFLRRRP